MEKKTTKKATASKTTTKKAAAEKTEIKETKKTTTTKTSTAKKASTASAEKTEVKETKKSSDNKKEFSPQDRPFAKYNRGYPNKQGRRKKFCKLCAKGQEHVDYKDVELLYKYLTPNLKIASRKITFACSKHQTRVSNAIKRARIVALIPFVRD